MSEGADSGLTLWQIGFRLVVTSMVHLLIQVPQWVNQCCKFTCSASTGLVAVQTTSANVFSVASASTFAI